MAVLSLTFEVINYCDRPKPNRFVKHQREQEKQGLRAVLGSIEKLIRGVRRTSAERAAVLMSCRWQRGSVNAAFTAL